MPKENSKGEEHNELPRDSLRERYSLNFPRSERPHADARDSTTATTGTAERLEKRPAPRAAASATTGVSENGSVSTGP
jgi:hypothetical protein